MAAEVKEAQNKNKGQAKLDSSMFFFSFSGQWTFIGTLSVIAFCQHLLKSPAHKQTFTSPVIPLNSLHKFTKHGWSPRLLSHLCILSGRLTSKIFMCGNLLVFRVRLRSRFRRISCRLLKWTACRSYYCYCSYLCCCEHIIWLQLLPDCHLLLFSLAQIFWIVWLNMHDWMALCNINSEIQMTKFSLFRTSLQSFTFENQITD